MCWRCRTPVKSVWAIPEDARLSPAQARELAALLEMDVRELNRRLAAEKDFVFIKRQIPPDTAEKIAALNLPGIHQQREYRRYYPAGEVTAHMLGFTGVDDKGQEGIELAFDAQLAGKPGSRRVIKDRLGRIVEDVESIKSPQEGRDIALALDAKIQYLAFTHLKQALHEHKAKAGGVVVLDARTGEVLALANLPAYNPNNRVKLTGAQLRNRALTDIFEPGSTMKPFTVALALEKGRYRFDSQIQTAPGRLTIGNATISDAHPHGMLTVAQVIQKSSNVGAAKIASSFAARGNVADVRRARLRPAARGSAFPGEVGGRLRPFKTWRPIEQATMSYGHGISVTLMQLARAYTAFARDGDLMPLSLTRRGITAARGRIQSFPRRRRARCAPCSRWPCSPAAPRPRRRSPGYRVAGKTGTAHKLEGGSYAEQVCVVVRRLCAGVRSATDGGGDDRRALRRQVFRRRSGGAGLRAGDGRRAAHAGRGAGCAADTRPGGAGARAAGAGETVKRELENAQRVLDELQRQGVMATSLCADSRAVAPGDVFVAFPGERADGRRFIADAVARGAAGVLWE